ncbi:hypothetical protein SUGI_0464150 [Cryptomeria japonica]|nr:hypothetical protein SUGI_0464150 [Cryptomeria japonica]
MNGSHRVKKLGIVAEHGYFFRWQMEEEWETCVQVTDFGWKAVVRHIFKLYTSIEEKESAISILVNEPVVKSGQQIVEVKPQGVSNGVAVEKPLTSMASQGSLPDFIYCCIGDDRSDEIMFEIIDSAMASLPKPSKSSGLCLHCWPKPKQS